MADFEYNYNLSDYIVVNKTGVYRNNAPLTQYHGIQFDNGDIRKIMNLFLNKVSLRFKTIDELHFMISVKMLYAGPIVFPNPNLNDMDLSDQYGHCDICFRIKDTDGTIGYWCIPRPGLGCILYQKEDNNFYKTKKGFRKEKFMEIVQEFLEEFPGESESKNALFLLSKCK